MVLRPVSTLSNSVTLQRVIASILTRQAGDLTKKRAAAGLSHRWCMLMQEDLHRKERVSCINPRIAPDTSISST